MGQRRISWIISGVGILLLAGTILLYRELAQVYAARNAYQPATAGTPSVFQEGADLHGVPAPPFTLQDQTGATVSLDQFRGRPVVLTFFDSVCPHADCSLMAQYINYTAKDLGSRSGDVAWVALTVNPWHDTPASATAFLTSRQVTIPMHYLLGSPDQMAPLWQAYHMQAILQSNGVVIHSTGVYVLDAQGRERAFLDEGFDPSVLAAYLGDLLKNAGAPNAGGGGASGTPAGAVTLAQQVDGHTVDFNATPGQFGTYDFTVTVEDSQGVPVQGASIDLNLTMPSMVMSPVNVRLAPMNPPVPGSYQARGVISMTGPWRAVVQIQAPGAQPVKATFDFNAKY
jgi:protein SCO1